MPIPSATPPAPTAPLELAERAQPKDIPSVDRLLRLPELADSLARHGHALLAAEARRVLEARRQQALRGELTREALATPALIDALEAAVARRLAPAMRPVFNLTGTVIHTNLGRAVLAESALHELLALMSAPGNLEYRLDDGGRGDRDELVESLLCELTGAQAATVVNNNAAAVLLTIAALARGAEVIVSRGELVEIGGAFRMPDVMSSAGATLVEVGTTNRTHPHDYQRAIGPRTALIMKVHTSNYAVQGFASSVDEAQLAPIAREAGLPLATDLGSGSLVDLAQWGLPREPLPQEKIAAGCDVVSFSGDKLLGGPQAGLIVGSRGAIERIRRFPMKRALRVSKLPLAVLEATLRLYLRPDRLTRDLPVLRQLTRPLADIQAQAERLLAPVAQALAPRFGVAVMPMLGQIGSGSLPIDRLPSAGLAISPAARRGTGLALDELSQAWRALSRPVISRIAEDRLLLDLRCLDGTGDEAQFVAQLPELGARLA